MAKVGEQHATYFNDVNYNSLNRQSELEYDLNIDPVQEALRRQVSRSLATEAAQRVKSSSTSNGTSTKSNSSEKSKFSQETKSTGSKKVSSAHSSVRSRDLKELSLITAEIDSWDENAPPGPALGSSTPGHDAKDHNTNGSDTSENLRSKKANMNRLSELSLSEEVMTDLGIGVLDESIDNSPQSGGKTSQGEVKHAKSGHLSGLESRAQENAGVDYCEVSSAEILDLKQQQAYGQQHQRQQNQQQHLQQSQPQSYTKQSELPPQEEDITYEAHGSPITVQGQIVKGGPLQLAGGAKHANQNQIRSMESRAQENVDVDYCEVSSSEILEQQRAREQQQKNRQQSQQQDIQQNQQQCYTGQRELPPDEEDITYEAHTSPITAQGQTVKGERVQFASATLERGRQNELNNDSRSFSQDDLRTVSSTPAISATMTRHDSGFLQEAKEKMNTLKKQIQRTQSQREMQSGERNVVVTKKSAHNLHSSASSQAQSISNTNQESFSYGSLKHEKVSSRNVVSSTKENVEGKDLSERNFSSRTPPQNLPVQEKWEKSGAHRVFDSRSPDAFSPTKFEEFQTQNLKSRTESVTKTGLGEVPQQYKETRDVEIISSSASPAVSKQDTYERVTETRQNDVTNERTRVKTNGSISSTTAMSAQFQQSVSSGNSRPGIKTTTNVKKPELQNTAEREKNYSNRSHIEKKMHQEDVFDGEVSTIYQSRTQTKKEKSSKKEKKKEQNNGKNDDSHFRESLIVRAEPRADLGEGVAVLDLSGKDGRDIEAKYRAQYDHRITPNGDVDDGDLSNSSQSSDDEYVSKMHYTPNHSQQAVGIPNQSSHNNVSVVSVSPQNSSHKTGSPERNINYPDEPQPHRSAPYTSNMNISFQPQLTAQQPIRNKSENNPGLIKVTKGNPMQSENPTVNPAVGRPYQDIQVASSAPVKEEMITAKKKQNEANPPRPETMLSSPTSTINPKELKNVAKKHKVGKISHKFADREITLTGGSRPTVLKHSEIERHRPDSSLDGSLNESAISESSFTSEGEEEEGITPLRVTAAPERPNRYSPAFHMTPQQSAADDMRTEAQPRSVSVNTSPGKQVKPVPAYENGSHQFRESPSPDDPLYAQEPLIIPEVDERMQYQRYPRVDRTRSPSEHSSTSSRSSVSIRHEPIHQEPVQRMHVQRVYTGPVVPNQQSPIDRRMMNGHTVHGQRYYEETKTVTQQGPHQNKPVTQSQKQSVREVYTLDGDGRPDQIRKQYMSTDSGIGMPSPSEERYSTIEREYEERSIKSRRVSAENNNNVSRVFVNSPSPAPQQRIDVEYVSRTSATPSPTRSQVHSRSESRNEEIYQRSPSPFDRSRSPSIYIAVPGSSEYSTSSREYTSTMSPVRTQTQNRIVTPSYVLEKHRLETEIVQGSAPSGVKVEAPAGPTPLYRKIEILPTKAAKTTRHDRETEVLKQELVETIVNESTSDYDEYVEVNDFNRAKWDVVEEAHLERSPQRSPEPVGAPVTVIQINGADSKHHDENTYYAKRIKSKTVTNQHQHVETTDSVKRKTAGKKHRATSPDRPVSEEPLEMKRMKNVERGTSPDRPVSEEPMRPRKTTNVERGTSPDRPVSEEPMRPRKMPNVERGNSPNHPVSEEPMTMRNAGNVERPTSPERPVSEEPMTMQRVENVERPTSPERPRSTTRLYVQTPNDLPELRQFIEEKTTTKRTVHTMEMAEEDILSSTSSSEEDEYSDEEDGIPVDENFNVDKQFPVETSSEQRMITNNVETAGAPRYVDIDEDDNVNVFDQQFFVNRENPLYHSEENLNRVDESEIVATRIERVETEARAQEIDEVDHVVKVDKEEVEQKRNQPEETEDLLRDVLGADAASFFYEYQGTIGKNKGVRVTDYIKQQDAQALQKAAQKEQQEAERETHEEWSEETRIRTEEVNQNFAAIRIDGQLVPIPRNVRQSIHVDREEEEIQGGGILLNHADGSGYKTDSSTVNFDTVNECVDLGIENGVARVAVKVTCERIVPVNPVQDVWKKNAVIVTRLIEFDLEANPETRRMYERIINSRKTNKREVAYIDSRGREHIETQADRTLNAKETMKVFSTLMNAAGEKNEFERHNVLLSRQDSSASDISFAGSENRTNRNVSYRDSRRAELQGGSSRNFSHEVSRRSEQQPVLDRNVSYGTARAGQQSASESNFSYGTTGRSEQKSRSESNFSYGTTGRTEHQSRLDSNMSYGNTGRSEQQSGSSSSGTFSAATYGRTTHMPSVPKFPSNIHMDNNYPVVQKTQKGMELLRKYGGGLDRNSSSTMNRNTSEKHSMSRSHMYRSSDDLLSSSYGEMDHTRPGSAGGNYASSTERLSVNYTSGGSGGGGGGGGGARSGSAMSNHSAQYGGGGGDGVRSSSAMSSHSAQYGGGGGDGVRSSSAMSSHSVQYSSGGGFGGGGGGGGGGGARSGSAMSNYSGQYGGSSRASSRMSGDFGMTSGLSGQSYLSSREMYGDASQFSSSPQAAGDGLY